MKVAACLALAFLVFQQSNGCDQRTDKQTPQPSDPPVQRFVPVTSHGSADVALDTKTGALCRTWNWEYKNNPETHGLDDLVLCNDLYTYDLPNHGVKAEDLLKQK